LGIQRIGKQGKTIATKRIQATGIFMKLAILGCGYVANMYRLTLSMHPELTLVGVYDRERSRAETMSRLTKAQAYPDFQSLLEDEQVSLVLNLTNPASHYATTKALLTAGKHVYSEKPLAMRLDHAEELTDLAEAKGLLLVSAPCTLLNPVAQTLWQAVRDDRIGRIRLVHAEMEDGMVARAPTSKWINEGGIAWPTIDEFQTGCTVEHAGYVLTWLCAMFGPAVRLTAHSEELMPGKIPGVELASAPDYSVATIRFASGVVARLTNGIYAEHDHRLRLFGDDGVLDVEDPRSDTSPIRLRRYHTIRRRRFLSPISRKLPKLGGKETIAAYRGSQTRDFCRAIADMARAIRTGTRPVTDARFALHVTELTLAAHFASHETAQQAGFPGGLSMPYEPKSRFDPITPVERV
jgi:predicted dehydrogenase